MPAFFTMPERLTAALFDWARRALPRFDAVALPGPLWRPLGRGALLLPQDAGTDGMYVLVLRQSGSTVS